LSKLLLKLASQKNIHSTSLEKTERRCGSGYARVSTSDWNPELQLDALHRAECTKTFSEKASGARDDRPELARILTRFVLLAQRT